MNSGFAHFHLHTSLQWICVTLSQQFSWSHRNCICPSLHLPFTSRDFWSHQTNTRSQELPVFPSKLGACS